MDGVMHLPLLTLLYVSIRWFVGARCESIALHVLFWFSLFDRLIVGWLAGSILRAPPFLAGVPFSTMELVETRHKFRGENDAGF